MSECVNNTGHLSRISTGDLLPKDGKKHLGKGQKAHFLSFCRGHPFPQQPSKQPGTAPQHGPAAPSPALHPAEEQAPQPTPGLTPTNEQELQWPESHSGIFRSSLRPTPGPTQGWFWNQQDPAVGGPELREAKLRCPTALPCLPTLHLIESTRNTQPVPTRFRKEKEIFK